MSLHPDVTVIELPKESNQSDAISLLPVSFHQTPFHFVFLDYFVDFLVVHEIIVKLFC
jgi:hypothetical protein